MTREEFVKEFRGLPLQEQQALVEEMIRSIQETREPKRHTVDEKLAAVNRLRGAFKTNGPLPTDEELKEDYVNYLMKKYS